MTMWETTKYSVARFDGHKLYFRAAFYGVFCLIVAFFLHILTISLSDTYLHFSSSVTNNFLSKIIKKDLLEYAYLAILSIVVGATFWLPLNFIQKLIFNFIREYFCVYKLPKYFTEYAMESAIRDNDVEALLFSCATKSMPLAATMDSGKVYVGYVINTPDPSMNRSALTLLPIASGYRNDEDHDVVFTTDYKSVYALIDEDENLIDQTDFSVVLPLASVSSLSSFDFGVFEKFHADP